MRPGEIVSNIDIREITNITIPPYNDKYYFDFIICVLDTTTDKYWATNLWTQKVCPDLRYYLSKQRKRQYSEIGLGLAQKYTETFILGHINLKTGRLKSSSGISKLLKHGWLPTISLLPQPYGEMIRIIESKNDMERVKSFVVHSFNAKFLQDILDRWLEASLVQNRKEILSSAIECYKSKHFIPTIYILLPQIEGLITEHIKRKGQSPKSVLKERFEQIGNIIKGEAFNTKMTRYLTDILLSNLKNTFYKTWYPYRKKGKLYAKSSLSPQRNVTLHGEINLKYFTQENCIKLICIVDAIILLSLTKNEIPAARSASLNN